MKANFSFQPTSVASESVFNIDKLVMFWKSVLHSKTIKQLFQVDDDENQFCQEGLVVTQNFMRKRINEEEFRICSKCPAPHHSKNGPGDSKYKIKCS